MFDFLEEILREFKDIPGLSFLRSIHTKFLVHKVRIRQKTEGIRVLQNRVQGSARQLQNLGSKAKNKVSKRRNEQ
jgi:hypothetical protein